MNPVVLGNHEHLFCFSYCEFRFVDLPTNNVGVHLCRKTLAVFNFQQVIPGQVFIIGVHVKFPSFLFFPLEGATSGGVKMGWCGGPLGISSHIRNPAAMNCYGYIPYICSACIYMYYIYAIHLDVKGISGHIYNYIYIL